jgi:uncharacterized protein YuzE
MLSTTELSDGTHTLVATDAAGNQSTIASEAAPLGIHPVVVGGMAVYFWTASEEFVTYDIDVVMEVPDELAAITIAGISFDHHHYDERGDVLYLNVGEPRPAARGLETPDGHSIHYDESGAVIGITLLNVRHTLEREANSARLDPA